MTAITKSSSYLFFNPKMLNQCYFFFAARIFLRKWAKKPNFVPRKAVCRRKMATKHYQNMGELTLNRYSITEYLKQDDASALRCEFINGEIVAMAGSSLKHNEISGNIFAALRAALRAKVKPCKTYMSDARLQITQRNSYYYPDVMIACEFADWADNRNIQSPSLIVEVLSESTQSIDLTTKLSSYLQIPSLNYYLIVAQTETLVLCYERSAQGWLLHVYDELSEIVSLRLLEISLSLADIYENL